jgi:hypothetical protein
MSPAVFVCLLHLSPPGRGEAERLRIYLIQPVAKALAQARLSFFRASAAIAS